ncbi:amidohydrolase [Alphaproteobacteria bacterium]|nr:amidohydrolase [Alphaproteobacteria bacterium]
MMRILFVFLLSTIAALAQASDSVLLNGKIYTVDRANPWAEALVIEDGKLIYVGNDEGAEKYILPDSEVIDLQEAFVMPGIHDVHTHPLEAFDGAEGECILTDGQSAKAHANRVKKCAQQQGDRLWITAWGFYIEDILRSKPSPRVLLDKAVPDRPVAIMELTSHAMWVNSRALEVAGITADTPNPPGGIIVKDKNGQPNGILLDNAGNLIREYVTDPTSQNLELTYQGLQDGLYELSKNGITSVSDARVYWTRKHHEVWQRAEREGTLTARVNLALWTYPHMDDGQIDILKSLYSNDANSMLRANQIKVYSDGIVSLTTAAMKREYEHDFRWVKGNKGLSYFDEDRLTKFITELETVGFDFLIHVIGDRATEEALSAIAKARKANGELGQRHRLSHLEIVDKSDISRFVDLDVTADMQVSGEWTYPSAYKRDIGFLIGKRADHPIPLKQFHDAGVRVTLSSDFDVSTMNPFVGMKNAISRGSQSLPSIEDAIRAYTINAAYSMRQETWTGSLEVGKEADLIILDRDITRVSKSRLAKTKVLMTMLAGEPVYKDRKF